MKEQFKEVTQEMPILGSKYTKSIPLGMFDNFRQKLMLYYGRSPERLSTHRGLTVKEALEIFFTEGTMPPKNYYEGALQGEVSIYKQVKAEGGEYGPAVYTEHDYKDCQPIVLKGNIAHLKYMKMVRNLKEAERRPLPDVLYYACDTASFYSFEAGVKVSRNRDFYAFNTPIHAPLGERLEQPKAPDLEGTLTPSQTYAELTLLRHGVATLFEAIKHGDDDHQAWLREAIRCHFAREPMPEYVAGKSKVGEQVAEFFSNVKTEQKPIAGNNHSELWSQHHDEHVHPSQYSHRPDEPFFVLLGRDPQAPDMLEHWADIRELAEPGDWKVANARQLAKDMRVFKAANPTFGMGKDAYDQALPTYLQQQAEQFARNVPITEMPRHMTVDLDATIGKNEARPEIVDLARLAARNPDALPFALQLIGAHPCPNCQYIHTHCRCGTPREDKPTHLVVSSIPPEWPKDHPVLKGEWKVP